MDSLWTWSDFDLPTAASAILELRRTHNEHGLQFYISTGRFRSISHFGGLNCQFELWRQSTSIEHDQHERLQHWWDNWRSSSTFGCLQPRSGHSSQSLCFQLPGDGTQSETAQRSYVPSSTGSLYTGELQVGQWTISIGTGWTVYALQWVFWDPVRTVLRNLLGIISSCINRWKDNENPVLSSRIRRSIFKLPDKYVPLNLPLICTLIHVLKFVLVFLILVSASKRLRSGPSAESGLRLPLALGWVDL